MKRGLVLAFAPVALPFGCSPNTPMSGVAEASARRSASLFAFAWGGPVDREAPPCQAILSLMMLVGTS